jgi:paraquat-inducible protein A
MDSNDERTITCPTCGRVHREVRITFLERALCTRCGSRLHVHGPNRDAALAFTLTALILAIPALQMPLVVVRKFGAEHASYLWTGVKALWQDGFPLLSVWVALCGIAVPFALLAMLTFLVASAEPRRFSLPGNFWPRFAQAIQHWSMPEVQVLAVLVAFVKIGALVDVDPGPGLWFYAAMTLAMLLGWRATDYEVHG